ncbi:MAG: hypothetical protein AAFO07_13695 [Bacteroidota bacterium]
MKKVLLFTCMLLAFWEIIETSILNQPATHHTIVELELQYDSIGIPDGYKAYINTPVCESDKCYMVKIHFYWDLIGRFQEFDTIPGEGLTKLDHIPFTTKDYDKLFRLLVDPTSPIASYSKEDLVQNTRESEIDGFTGATIREIKDIVISGGVYSCFTLWHIAHGDLVDSFQLQTASLFDTILIEKLVTTEDQDINYYLIEHFSAQDFRDFLPQVLKTLDIEKGYYAKNMIEKMPTKVVSDTISQVFFTTHFKELNYFSQVALLKKLDKAAIIPSLAATLKQELDERSTARNHLIKELLSLQ